MSLKQTLTWQAPEYRHYPKNVGWYVTLIAVGVLIIGFFIIQKDIFAAITSAILVGFVVFFSRQEPEMVTVTLDHKTLKFGDIVYPYKQMKYFWIVLHEHHRTLNFISTSYVNNSVIVELEDQDPEEVRDLLLEHLPEHEQTEPTLTQKISHRLKF